MELIPDLPDDLARECLLRASYEQFAVILSVCKGWRLEVRLPEFSQHRKASRHSQKLLVMAQARVDPAKKLGSLKSLNIPVYRITVIEPSTGNWTELPPIPGLPNGLPMFCRLATAGPELVVMGGLDPLTWQACDSVFIFNFVSATWRSGESMPGVRRSFFGCTSDLNRTVYVAGGHDDDKNALRSAMMYDVAEDKWVLLPDMAEERDECSAVFLSGELHVIGGYSTEGQGRFGKSAETFSIATWNWGPVEADFLYAASCPTACVAGDTGEFYMCDGSDVMVRKNGTWHHVRKLPDDVWNMACVALCEGKLLMIGSSRFGNLYKGYMLDLDSRAEIKLETGEKYSGHVQTGCFLEI